VDTKWVLDDTEAAKNDEFIEDELQSSDLDLE
jgi:hypothetical protein